MSTEETQVKTPPKSSMARSFVSVINGSYFSKEEAVRRLPFILFIVGLTLGYIANGYYAESTVRSINKIEIELKELRSEYITSKSDLMYKSKQSEVAKMLTQKGIEVKEALEPPKKIVVKKEELN